MSEARQTFGIHTEYIDLLQFLKATGIAATGGEAKAIVDEGFVTVNGEAESRRRRKLRPGDTLDLALDPAEAWVISERKPEFPQHFARVPWTTFARVKVQRRGSCLILRVKLQPWHVLHSFSPIR